MQTETAKFECQTCRGTGKVQIGYVNIRLVNCRACKGRGSFNTDEETRMVARAKAKEAKARKVAGAHAMAEEFLRERPEIEAWFVQAMQSSNLGFAEFSRSLYQALFKFGRLTPGQLASVENSLIKAKEREAEREAKTEEPKWTPPFADNLMKAFAHAQASGLHLPEGRQQRAVPGQDHARTGVLPLPRLPGAASRDPAPHRRGHHGGGEDARPADGHLLLLQR